jgi:amidohydrolase
MGVAEALAARRAQLPGAVMFVFQPAEEGPPAGETGGAAQMLAEGLFDHFKPEAMFGLHADTTLHAGEIGLRGGPLQAAADSFRIVVKGRQTHGARPWMGIDPIIVAADIVGDAQSIVSRRLDLTLQPAVLSFGAIRGGLRNNIIPEEVELIGTIRSFDPTMRQQMIDTLRRIAEHAATAQGASVEAQIPDAPGYPVLVNDAALVERIRPGLQRALGAENVKAVPLYTSSEDFAEYARRVPSVFLRLGVVPDGHDPASVPTNHSPRFDLDEAALNTGVRALFRICLDYLGAEASVKP